MKFAGELRIPEVDHPGIPATVLVEDTQIEIVLDGESIGRWSLYDVRARRLISKAFALDLAGEEVVFLADEPVDFAYRGVEQMAQIWAQLKSMRGPQRMMAVRKSRAGTKVSRVEELREAMEANLQARKVASDATPVEEAAPDEIPSRPPPNWPSTDDETDGAVEATPLALIEDVFADPAPADPEEAPIDEAVEEDLVEVADDLEPQKDTADEVVEDEPVEEVPVVDEPVVDEPVVMEPVVDEPVVMEPVVEEPVVEEPVVATAGAEAGRSVFERLQAEAAARDQLRIQAFRAEMAKLEAEQAEAERVEEERKELFESEMERLKTDMRALKAAEAEASAQGVDPERASRVQAEIRRIEESRLQLERTEAERLAGDLRRREAVLVRKTELERQEAERWESQRREMDRLRAEAEVAERIAAERAAQEKLAAERAAEQRAAEQREAEQREAEQRAAEQRAIEAARKSQVEPEVAKAPIAPPSVPLTPLQKLAYGGSEEQTSSVDEVVAPHSGEPESEPESEPGPEPAPAISEQEAPVAKVEPPKEKGLLGAVKGAFSRGSAPHEHQFVTAPGTLGISRSICTECGFVSIGTSDD